MNVIQADHIFSHFREDAKEKETEITNKGGCCKFFDYFKDVTAINGLKDLLNEPLMPQEF